MGPPRDASDHGRDPRQEHLRDVRRAMRTIRADMARMPDLTVKQVEQAWAGPSLSGWNARQTLAMMRQPKGAAPGFGEAQSGSEARGHDGHSWPGDSGPEKTHERDTPTWGESCISKYGPWNEEVFPNWPYVNWTPTKEWYEKGPPGSDFTPPRGRYRGATKAPGGTRMMLAISGDGLTWRKTGMIICDQAAVPTAIQANGVVYLFFVLACIGEQQDWEPSVATRTSQVVMAFSEDLVTWTYRYLKFDFDEFDNKYPDAASWHARPFDPTVIASEDGGYLMYFTLCDAEKDHEATMFATFAAYAEDLESGEWTVYPQKVFPSDDAVDPPNPVQDPVVLWVVDHYEYFAGGDTSGVYHASSIDDGKGLDFEPYGIGDGLTSYTWIESAIELQIKPGNGAVIDGEYKIYAIVQDGSDGWIVSMTGHYYSGFPTYHPKNGPTITAASSVIWTVDDDTRLVVSDDSVSESDFVMGPAVCAAPPTDIAAGSCYVMAYITKIPDPHRPEGWEGWK